MKHKVRILLAFFAAIILGSVAYAQNSAAGVGVIVIDAGHGGAFPGAIYGKVKEKDLNLKVALKLGALIEKELPDVKVVYTRKTDIALGKTLNDDLTARANIANKAGGDFFISIHANAAPKATSVHGAETIIMGESEKETRYNESVLYNNNKDELIDMSDENTAAMVRAYIQNLQFTYGEYSEMMARIMQSHYAKGGRNARRVNRQLLKVLYATDMPSVLTEIGFMSNPEELKYMTSEKGQNEIAENLYNAVKEYADFVRRSLLVEEPSKGVAEAKPAAQQAAETVQSVTSQVVAPSDADAQKIANLPIRKPEDKSVKVVDTKSVKKLPEPSSQLVAVVESVATQPKAEPEAEAKTGKPVETKVEPKVEPRVEPKDNGSKERVAVESVKPSGRAFVVQIMASATSLSTDDARFGKQRGKVCQYVADGAYKYKYCVGRYSDRESAQRAAMSLREEFNGAFVVEVDGNSVVKR